MVKLADIQISVPNPTSTSREDHEVKISCPATVDSNGLFTVTLPEHLVELATTWKLPVGVIWDRARVHTRLQGKVLESLKTVVTELLTAFLAPEVSVERVIRYNVDSHVSFAEDDNGNIFPNGSFSGARWADSLHFGDHHATQPSAGGYSLTVGARAYDKHTIRRGDAVKVEYQPVKVGHVGNPNDPLNLLNGWASFSLPEKCKEMPYTPEAAMFFHRMMESMAELSRRVQTFMHDEPQLLAAIRSGHKLLGAPQPQPRMVVA
ncbi:hypothetical protein AB4Y45_34615 [Paraburkholderia sp. EG287A]|uniref:hypothetical protein n=1 Tax=Paraburkholderia sp. EG287A TaxID=3237012 RepID=UPI0034D2D4CE